MEIIDSIRKGCKLILQNFINRKESPKQYANLKRHTKIKPAMRDFVIIEVIKIFQQNPKESFRRNDIKIRLPEFIKLNYYDSELTELTRILQYLVDLNLISHSRNIQKKKAW
jgi:hypothetical protein